MAFTNTIDILVYCCFCYIFILTIPIFFWRRRYTLVSERTPYLELWMQVPVFGLMTILCLLYSALIPDSYGVTILTRCLQTLVLCSVTTRIVNVVIKSIQQQHIQSILRNQMPLLGAPSDTKNPDSGRSGTVQYLWWQSAHRIKLGRYHKIKHTFTIYALVCVPWFIALATIFATNEPSVGDATLNESLFWYRVSIGFAQISIVFLMFLLVVLDVFFMTIEIGISTFFLLGDTIVLLACRYVPPEPSQVLEAGTCSHYTYGCLFFVHVLSIMVPALLTFIPVMRTQRVPPLSDVEEVKEGAGDNDDSTAFGLKCSAALDSHTPLNTNIGVIDAERTAQNNDTSYFSVE